MSYTDVPHTCRFIDGVIGMAQDVDSVICVSVENLAVLLERIKENPDEVLILSDIEKVIHELKICEDFSDDLSSEMEVIREMNSDLRRYAEDYGDQANALNGELAEMEDTLYEKDLRISELEEMVSKLEEKLDGENYTKPRREWRQSYSGILTGGDTPEAALRH